MSSRLKLESKSLVTMKDLRGGTSVLLEELGLIMLLNCWASNKWSSEGSGRVSGGGRER